MSDYLNHRDDDNFYKTLYDDEGNPVRVLKEQITIVDNTSSGFTTYDSSHGHCSFCGSLTCRGSCFK